MKDHARSLTKALKNKDHLKKVIRYIQLSGASSLPEVSGRGFSSSDDWAWPNKINHSLVPRCQYRSPSPCLTSHSSPQLYDRNWNHHSELSWDSLFFSCYPRLPFLCSMVEQLILLHFHLTLVNSDCPQFRLITMKNMFSGLLHPARASEDWGGEYRVPCLESVSWHLGIHFTHLPSDFPYSMPVRTHELDATRSTVALRIFNGALILEASLKSGHWRMCYLNLLTGENVFIWLLKFRFSDKHLHKPITSSRRPRERRKALPAPSIKYLFRGQVCSGSR